MPLLPRPLGLPALLRGALGAALTLSLAAPAPGASSGLGFSALTTNAAEHLYGLHFTDAASGYAVGWLGGGDAVVLGTSDAGQSWAQLRVQPGGQLFNVHSQGAVVLAVGHDTLTQQGLVLRSTDSGAQWSEQRLADTFGLYDVQFVGPTTAFACGYNSGLYRSDDAGATWVRATGVPAGEVFRDLSFADANVGYALGGSAFQGKRVYRTVDGGATWTKVKTFGSQVILSKLEAMPEHPLGARFVMLVGYRPSGESVLTSTDGGATWSTALQTSANQVFQSMTVRGSRCWVGGIAGALYGSDDFGATWTSEPAPTGFALSLALTPGALYCGGTGGGLFRSRLR